MRNCTVIVRELLDSWTPESQVAFAELYTFTLASGEVFRYTSWQSPISAPAPGTDAPLVDFARGPRINRNTTKTQIGIEVDVLNIQVFAIEADLVASGGSISWQDAIIGGLFDGASVELWRCLMSPPGNVIGTITWFYGHVGDIEVGRTGATIRVKSLLNLLNSQMPKRLIQSSCTFVFGDAQCGFNREVDGAAGPGGGGPSYAVNLTSTAVITQSQITFGAFVPSPVSLFNQGTLVGLTGSNAGYKRTIMTVKDGIAYLYHPWIFPAVPGDQFRLLPGDDHKLETCTNVFNNLARFGGFPYIPPPETAV